MRQLRKGACAQRRHHLAKWRAGRAVRMELPFFQLLNGRCRRESFQAVFVVAGINHANELNQEWIKTELVISAIGSNQGDRSGRSRLYSPGLLTQGPDFISQRAEHAAVGPDAIRDGFFQLRLGSGINHLEYFTDIVLQVCAGDRTGAGLWLSD